MKDKVMSEKTAKVLVVVSAIFLLLVGFGLYKLFEYQGINKDTTSRKIVNYDIKDYVEKIAKYKLLDNYFPEVCKVLNDNNFKIFLAKESAEPENKRELNTDLDVFNKMYLYSGNKKEFLNECRILEEARSTKQSKILSEIKKKEFCIGCSIL